MKPKGGQKPLLSQGVRKHREHRVEIGDIKPDLFVVQTTKVQRLARSRQISRSHIKGSAEGAIALKKGDLNPRFRYKQTENGLARVVPTYLREAFAASQYMIWLSAGSVWLTVYGQAENTQRIEVKVGLNTTKGFYFTPFWGEQTVVRSLEDLADVLLLDQKQLIEQINCFCRKHSKLAIKRSDKPEIIVRSQVKSGTSENPYTPKQGYTKTRQESVAKKFKKKARKLSSQL